VTSDDGQQGEEFSTTELVTLLHERLDNKSRRVARAMQFNLVTATAAVGVGQLAGGSVTIPLNTTVKAGSVFLLASFAAGFAGLAAVGHPLVSVDRSPASVDQPSASVDANRDRQATAPDGVVTELRRRNRAVAVTQSLSFATGTLGTGLVLLGAVRSLGVTTNRFSFSLVVVGAFAVVFVGHTVGHAVARLSGPSTETDEHGGRRDTGES
jgi:hypothetical protein